MNIFERIDAQDKLWKFGAYDYLVDQNFEIRFFICSYYIKKHFQRKIEMIDIGAGSGTLYTMNRDIIKKYDYNDVSSCALERFKQSIAFSPNNKEVGFISGNIANVKDMGAYDLIVAMGVAQNLYSQGQFELLYSEHLRKDGLLIIEGADEKIFSSYGKNLPTPIHSLKFEILDAKGFEKIHIRQINVYAKL